MVGGDAGEFSFVAGGGGEAYGGTTATGGNGSSVTFSSGLGGYGDDASGNNGHIIFNCGIYKAAIEVFRIDNTYGTEGRFGVGVTSPTAWMHLKASASGSAGTASLKFESGTLLGTAEAGALEYNGTSLFFTRSGTQRETIGTVVTKTDTGDGPGAEGLFQINTYDNTFKVYADGGWRSLETW
jgi:hypothetical protein